MELVNIEKLLEKYLDAETSIKEENELKAYFSGDEVAPHLEEYRVMFGYFSASKKEKFTKTIQLKRQNWNWKWLSVAASAILLVSVYTGYQKNQQAKAEKIYHETQFAFSMLSANLNKGTAAITELQEFENTTNKILKQPNK
jgi:transcription termination factor NusB